VKVELSPAEFDICGTLPTGVTVLEASAGTGKTYTIASLAARYVATGIPLERLLLVTFTRIATGELRERVRDRLVSVERGLTRALDGVLGREDQLLALLAEGSAGEVVERRDRLALAVASFDAATIATTHGFCQEVLGGLGIAGDLEPDVTFVEDLSDLASEVVDDLYVRRFSRDQKPPAFGREQAAAVARAAIDNPGATIVCGEAEKAQMRGRLAAAARSEYEARKRAMAVMTYDDLVMRLQSTLAGPGGAAAAQQLRSRYRVVLVDEFQDTDPAQWEIMNLAFAQTGVTLVLIADPKQAIYAFRGADVYAYLAAADAAGARATLPINWRSDQTLIDAHDALLSGVKFGHEGIAYRQVRAADAHDRSGLIGAHAPAPMRFRLARRDGSTMSLTPSGFAAAESARTYVADDLAADVVALLDSGATVPETGDERERVAIRPDHLAVLVRTNRQASMILDALAQAGVPAVINGAGSVFATAAARDWLALLEALDRPASSLRAHSAALTPFLGWTAERLAADDDLALEEIHRRLHDWARVLRGRGVASLLEAISVAEDLPARVLGDDDGERRLTDLRHIGQLLHAASSQEQLGAAALTAWLRNRIAEADQDVGDEERSRRLQSDARAVQVLTIHRSKGLEFPVVYLPFLWDMGRIPENEKRPAFFHDPDAGDARTIDVSLEGDDFARHRDRNATEERGEDLRLAYVALTRARHQVVIWWAGSFDSRHSPLARLLFSRDERGDVAASGQSTPSDASMLARLRKLAESAPASISVQSSAPDPAGRWQQPPSSPPSLTTSSFDRTLDLRWRRTSYTDITATVHDAWVTSEPEEPLIADEPAMPDPVGSPAQGAPDREPPAEVPLAAMPFGAEVGTFVHRVLEATDFAAADLRTELAGRIDEVRARRAVEIGDPDAVIVGLAAAIETPLGPVLDGLRLRDFARSERLDELGFELPLAGGDRPRGVTELSRIAAVLGEFLADDDPLVGYARRLGDADLRQSVRGYLTGSLDLVVRLPGPRFAVLDYKTNWLGELDGPLTADRYRAPALATEMQRHHYALQALLYLVALHRYLRWRLPGHDVEKLVAGVAYLFLRGMTGPTADDAPAGVFGWQPPAGLLTALSDALDAADAGR
jgi:exodeoxyribonuclease V beta subunit